MRVVVLGAIYKYIVVIFLLGQECTFSSFLLTSYMTT